MRKPSGPSPAVVLFSCLFAAQAAILVVSPILLQVAEEFGVTAATAAQLRSVSGITAGVVALGLAVRGDRYRLSRLLSVGLILLAAGSLASAAAPGFPALLAAQIPIGLGLALVLSGGLAASEAWARAGESARLLSWALVGQPVAWIVGQPIVGFVARDGWRRAWVAVPFVASVAALATVSLRRKDPTDEGRECDPVGLLRLPGIKVWALGELLAFAAWAGTLVYAGAFFLSTYDIGVGATGSILGLIAAAYIPGNFLARRWMRIGATRLLVAFGGSAAVTVAVLGAVRPGLAFSTLVFSVLSFLAAGRTIAGAALGLRFGEGHRLAAMSVRTAMLQFGYLFGTVVGAGALSRGGFAGVGWTFAGLFAAAAATQVPKMLAGKASDDTSAIRFRRSRKNTG